MPYASHTCPGLQAFLDSNAPIIGTSYVNFKTGDFAGNSLALSRRGGKRWAIAYCPACGAPLRAPEPKAGA